MLAALSTPLNLHCTNASARALGAAWLRCTGAREGNISRACADAYIRHADFAQQAVNSASKARTHPLPSARRSESSDGKFGARKVRRVEDEQRSALRGSLSGNTLLCRH
eukprot:IDg16690t1